jgi:hypothetical protein
MRDTYLPATAVLSPVLFTMRPPLLLLHPISECHNREYEQKERVQYKQKQKQQTPWLLVRERTIPTELPPLVDEI